MTTLTMPWASTKKDEEHVSVHVENFDDFKTTKTEEIEPEHFQCFTKVVIGSGPSGTSPGIHGYEQILALDPMRKKAKICALDGPALLVHSTAATSDPSINLPGIPFPQGALLLPSMGYTDVEGTGPLWVIGLPGSVSGASTIGFGSVLNPGAAQNIEATGSKPAGVYTVTVNTSVTGTSTPADLNNMQFLVGGTNVGGLLSPGSTTFTVVVPSGGAQFIVQSIAASSAGGVTYTAQIVATLISGGTATLANRICAIVTRRGA
jgi:hypothetical protein